MIQQKFSQWLDRFIQVDDPGSRLFHLNLITALVILVLWVIWQRKSFARFPKLLRRLVLRKSYWWNASTKMDYQIYALNSVLKAFLFVPLLECTFQCSKYTLQFLHSVHPASLQLEGHSWQLLGISVFAFVLDDFLRFSHHVLMHKIPLLWSLHRVHHSATTLTPITLYRLHPLESAMATVRNSLSLGISTGVFIYFFQGEFSLISLFGVNLWGMIFNLLGANLRHSHIPLSFGIFERIFISPKQHQIHHSLRPEHYDKNYGVSLSIWDALMGSYLPSGAAKRLRFGVDKPLGMAFIPAGEFKSILAARIESFLSGHAIQVWLREKIKAVPAIF